jgi:cysteinyl-tRNA synthetase
MNRRKEELIPLRENNISMYVCGPTVYDLLHIGNARPLVVFDTFRKYLERKGFKVNFVQNFTDIDDKIINRSAELNISAQELAEKYIAEAEHDIRGLNCQAPTVAPRATQVMDEIISMIQSLIDKGFAYEKNGSVFYNTEKFKHYGDLSGKNISDLISGARVDVNEEKQSPLDFVLWKPQKPGEPFWDSPWGGGRPGWHIECSAMTKKYLGDTFDIHAGGEDLIFPHHENEIAQSEAANGQTFARYWMHVGFININHEKMSKSKGNFFTLREIAEKYSYRVIRFFILSAHYRSPVNFDDVSLEAAANGLERISNSVGLLRYALENNSNNQTESEDSMEDNIVESVRTLAARFDEAMDDDLNTANAITAVYEICKFANTNINSKTPAFQIEEVQKILLELLDILGIEIDKPNRENQEIDRLVGKRQIARKNKDWATADSIRKKLSDMGVLLEDRADGIRWYYK